MAPRPLNNVGNAGGNYVPLDNFNPQAKIGGHNAAVGNQASGRTIDKIMSAVKSFFTSIGEFISRIGRADPVKVQERAAGKMDDALKGIVSELGQGEVSQTTVDNAVAFVRNAKKFDSNAPLQTVRDSLRDAISRMDDETFNTIKDTDFMSVINGVTKIIRQSAREELRFMGGLNNTGFLVSGGNLESTRESFKTQENEIRTFFVAMHDAVQNRQNRID